MDIPPGVLFQLYHVGVSVVEPSSHNMIMRTFEVEKPFAVSHSDVVAWVSMEFNKSPTRFLPPRCPRLPPTLLVIEAKYTAR